VIRSIILAAALLALPACSESCGRGYSKVDTQWREEQMSMHTFGNTCVILFFDASNDAAALAAFPCDSRKATSAEGDNE